jgi:glycosyltransferase involved in cell wall biosynthesis
MVKKERKISKLVLTSSATLDNIIEDVVNMDDVHLLIFHVVGAPNTILEYKESRVPKTGIYQNEEVLLLLRDPIIFKNYFGDNVTFSLICIHPSLNIISYFKVIIKFYSLFNSHKYDLIYFDDISARIIPFSYLRAVEKTCAIHDPRPHLGEYRIINTLIRKLFFRRMDLFEMKSDYSLKEWLLYYPNLKNVYVKKLNLYDVYKKFEPCRPFDLAFFDSSYFVFVGRVSPYKGLPQLIKAFESYLGHFQGSKLVIAGKGDGLEIPEILKDHILCINRFVNPRELVWLVKNSKSIILPYLEATQSGVLMMAMSLESKIICTDVGGLKEALIGYENHQIVLHSDSNALAKAMLKYT